MPFRRRRTRRLAGAFSAGAALLAPSSSSSSRSASSWVLGVSAASASSALSSSLPATELLGLPPCRLSSLELHGLGPDDVVEPCVLYDVRGGSGDDDQEHGGRSSPRGGGGGKTESAASLSGTTRPSSSVGVGVGHLDLDLPASQKTSPLVGDGAAVKMADDEEEGEAIASADDDRGGLLLFDDDPTLPNRTTEVTLVQVTPALCHNHRDGGVTGVRALNGDNGGRGGKIGFYENYYVKFRFISVVAGNHIQLGSEYSAMHRDLLESMLDIVNPQYIVGTCSFEASTEKEPAGKYGKIVVAQVGPPGFYKKTGSTPPSNDYVFGIHVNSDTYPIPALRSLGFHVKSAGGRGGGRPAAQPVRVLYRTKSEFFHSTCRSVVVEALASGFTDTVSIMYDPDADDDHDGTVNEADVDFLEGLADRACPPGSSANDGFEPALFGCVKSALEADTILNRWKANGCRPVLTWLTPSTWGWAAQRRDVIPYFQGGGQWHKNFRYSDGFFETGEALIEHNANVFGYTGSYDMVVCYAIPMLFYHHISSFFRIVDEPDVAGAFRHRYEEMRRSLLMLNTDTIFGPIRFDADQRNVGREAAGMQWVPAKISSNYQLPEEEEEEEQGADDDGTDHPVQSAESAASEDGDEFIQACVSPLSQAEVTTVVPAPSSQSCDAGSFVSVARITAEPSILWDKCQVCPEDAFASDPNESTNCTACPGGSSTEGETGSTHCVRVNSNLLPFGLLLMGYIMVGVNWALALGFMAWIYRYRKDAVVKVGQQTFLTLICFGVLVSSTAIIALGIQADVGEDTSTATAACQAAPFLYSVGWVIGYSSLTAKSWRLYRMLHSQRLRVRVTALQTLKFVFAAVALDLAVLISWQVVDPLVYERKEIGRSINAETGIITVETVGQCSNENGIWPFVGPLMGIHFSLVVVTNVLLFKLRAVDARYQEQKYIALASLYICEVLLLGLPILVAVRDSAAATYIALVGIIFFNDSGMLLFVFIPKVLYQRKGLPEGVSVGQSLIVTRQTSAEDEYRRRANQTSSLRQPSQVSAEDMIPVKVSGDNENSRSMSNINGELSLSQICTEHRTNCCSRNGRSRSYQADVSTADMSD